MTKKTMKVCTKCGTKTKHFYSMKRTHCIECERKDARYRMASLENRARGAFRHANKKAEQFGVANDLTYDDVMYLFKLAGGRCAYTGRFSNDLSLEHVIPMSAGGANTISNIIVVDISVNRMKNDRSFLEFIETKYNPYDIAPLVKLLAARGNRDYAGLYDELYEFQREECNAWYRRLMDKQKQAAV